MKKLEMAIVLIILAIGIWGLVVFLGAEEIGGVRLEPEKVDYTKPQGEVREDGFIVDEEGDLIGEVTNSPTGGGGGGSGSGGSGDSGDEEEGELFCVLKQISYSLRNFYEDFECTEYNINGCSKLTATCRTTVYNLDPTFTGDFEMEYTLIDSETSVILGNISISETLGPEKNKEFEAVFNLEDSGGINEVLNCNFKTTKIPQKQVCEWI